MSLGFLSLGSLGEAAADDVAVLPAPIAFLETVWRPGWLTGGTAPFFGTVGLRAGAEGAGGIDSRTGPNLFPAGEVGTYGGWCGLCFCMKDGVAVEEDWLGASARLEMDREALARYRAGGRQGELCLLLRL